MKHFLSFLATFVLCAFGVAQQSVVISSPETKPDAPSLAEQARKAPKNPGMKAKSVFTNDNLRVQKGPFPEIRPEQDDSDLILRAMIDYRVQHTAKETEDAIKAWYDLHASRFADAMNENRQIRERENGRYNAYQPEYRNETSYREAMARQRADMLSAQNDQKIVATNNRLAQRIVMTVDRLNYGLRGANLRYDWFTTKPFYDSTNYY